MLWVEKLLYLKREVCTGFCGEAGRQFWIIKSSIPLKVSFWLQFHRLTKSASLPDMTIIHKSHDVLSNYTFSLGSATTSTGTAWISAEHAQERVYLNKVNGRDMHELDNKVRMKADLWAAVVFQRIHA